MYNYFLSNRTVPLGMEKFNPVIFLDLQNGKEDSFRVERGHHLNEQIVVLHTMVLSRSAVLF